MRTVPTLLAAALAMAPSMTAWAEAPRVGPLQERLADDVLVNLPAGYRMTGAGPGRLQLEPHLPDPAATAPWSVQASWEPTGHVLDSDRLDADQLLDEIRARGRCQAWVLPPRYDATRHALSWELACQGDGGSVVEHHLRVLGRRGVLALDASAPTELRPSLRLHMLSLRMALPFADGAGYQDFRGGGEPVAPGGLSSLVRGRSEGGRGARLPAGRALAGGAAALLVALLVLGRLRRRPAGRAHSSG